MPENIEPSNNRYLVKSVAKAASLLEFLEADAGQAGVSLTAVADHLGVSKSSALGQVHTLRDFGLVSEVPGRIGAPRYRLGLALIRLGHSAAQQTSVGDFCRDSLQLLSAETSLSARVAVLDPEGWAVPVFSVAPPRASVGLDLRMGDKEWPHRSGIGKALMTMLPDREVTAIVERLGMPAATKHSLTSLDDLLNNLAEARQRGYCLDDEEDADGIMCVGAPVPDSDGRPFAALSVTGVKTDDFLDRLPLVAEAVRTHAVTLSQRLRPRSLGSSGGNES